jgi:hypothetical protein
MKFRHLIWLLAFALVATLGYWLAGTAAPPIAKRAVAPEPVRAKPILDEPMPKFRRGERMPVRHGDVEARSAGALEGQRVLVFKDQDALARFLARAGDRIDIMDRLDALNALRVGFSDYDDLLALLDGDEEQGFIFPVAAPFPGEGSVQPGAVALRNRLLEWLGITGDNSTWGEGVRIAILDSGVASHPAFDALIRSINLVPLPGDPSAQNGHGTAVASMIIGNDGLTPGVAPGSEIISVRIADDSGQSNSFTLAQGIIAAVDGGANLINISMGSFGDSVIVRNAIQYAIDRGALIIAAAGNNGMNQVFYPAANDGVIGVGGVDALGNHLDFSNTGDSIDISAPGFDIYAAWTGNQTVSVSGTSFSAPIVAGAIAGIMTEAGPGNLTPNQAWNLLRAYLNDGGAAGTDPQLGAGMPDMGRTLTGDTRGVYDAALASQRILPPDGTNPYGQVEILVQNRGTEPLINTTVKVNSGGKTTTVNVTTLLPDAVQTIRVPIPVSPASPGASVTIDSSVSLSGSATDAKPSNDRRVETYAPAGGQ